MHKFQKLLSHEFCVDTLLINHAQDTKITFKFPKRHFNLLPEGTGILLSAS